MNEIRLDELNLSPDLRNKLKKEIKPGEVVLWSRPGASSTTKPAGQIEVLTNRQILQISEVSTRLIAWGNVSLVRFNRSKGGRGSLLVERKDLHLGYAEDNYYIEFKNLPEIEKVRQVFEPLLVKENPQLSAEVGWSNEALGRNFPAEWLAPIRSELLPGERILWAGQPDREAAFRILVSDIYRRSRHLRLTYFYAEALIVGVLLPLILFLGSGSALVPWDYPVLAFLLEFQLVVMLAIVGYMAWRYWPNLAYVLTDRRVLQLTGRLRNSRYTVAEFYPGLNPTQFSLRPKFLFFAKGNFSDLVLKAEHRWNPRDFKHMHLIAFKGLARPEAGFALQLARQVFGDKTANRPAKVERQDYSENQLPVDPALVESGSQLRAELEPHLAPGERLLWAASTTVLDTEKFLIPLTYAITDRRAFTIEKNWRMKSAAWEKITRISMTRHSNGRGHLKLILKPDLDNNNGNVELKNCPEFYKVQRLVEQVYFRDDSDPNSPPEIEAEVAQPETARKEDGIPLRWRYRLEAELLPEEQLRWLGRANRKEITRVMGGCLLWGLAILVGVMLVGFWPLGLAILAMMLGALAFTFLVLLNTVYAVTDRRVLQVRGLHKLSPSRTIEFYPQLNFQEVQIAQDLPDYPGGARARDSDFIDLVIQKEIYPESRNYNSSGKSRRQIQFIGIHRKEVEEIKGFIKQISQRGPLIPGKATQNRKAEEAPRFDQGFGKLGGFPEVKPSTEAPPATKKSRKKPK